LQDANHVLSCERARHFDRQAFAGVLVDHGQQLQPTAVSVRSDKKS
jgi:hypothetical protein